MSFETHVLLRSEETAGQVSAIENTLPPRWAGPPLHRHDFDEAFYVLDGELTFELAGERIVATRGQLAFAPRNVDHTLANVSDAPARYLLVCTPAGFERYFGRMEAELAGVEPPEWALGSWPPVTRVGPPIELR
jgi:quercetin dioxygenase-like cupin family protein